MKAFRGFLLLLAVVAAPERAQAQVSDASRRIAVLTVARATLHYDVLLPEIAKYGFQEGRNLVIDTRVGRPEELPALAGGLVAMRPDAVFAISPAAVRAAMAATSTIPIVSLSSADPVRAGWVDNYARPGRNVTGVTILGAELDPKRLQLIRDLVPAARRLAVLRDVSVTSDERLGRIEEAARELGVAIEVIEAATPGEIADAMRRARQPGAFSAMAVLASPLFRNEVSHLVREAIASGVPTICHWRDMAEAGCLASYGPTFVETYRIAGSQLGRILAGDRIAEIPVERPNTFELVINLKTAQALGLKLSPAVLARADELIE